MNRIDFVSLKEWKNRPSRKPLVVRGARQVGKSWLITAFGAQEFENQLTVNVDRDRLFVKNILNEPPEMMVQLIELEYGVRVQPGKDLLFFDEIQAVPALFAKLRYFYEDMPDLHVIAAGSLLDFVLEDHTFSMPVGRVEYLYMGPMTFSEYLEASGNNRLKDYLASFELENGIPEALHKTLLRHFRLYVGLGGMPEVIKTYIETDSLLEADRVKESIIGTLWDDFGKYSRRVDHDRMLRVFNSLPMQIGRKLKYVNISREDSAREIKHCLHVLELAGLVCRIRSSACNGLPLGGAVRDSVYKLLFLDVGLMLRMCGLDASVFARSSDIMLVNSGAVAEQVVGQLLLRRLPSWQLPELYYWNREKASSSAEIDYVISLNGRIVPIEVKAGKSGSLRSLQQFIREKRVALSIRLNADKPSDMLMGNPDEAQDVACRLISLPLYLAEYVQKLGNEG